MKLVETRDVPLGEITIGKRIDALDEEWAQALAHSFLERGQDEAVRVARLADATLHLMAGRHRLRAAELVEWPAIRAAIWVPETDKPAAEMTLHEADENLQRRGLTALARAGHLAERQSAYQELYPDTRRGVAGGKARQGSATANLSFAESAAKRTGLSERSIQRAVKIWHSLSPDVRGRLARSHLADNAVQLELLADLAEPRQVLVVEVMLAEGGPRNVETAQAIVDGEHIVVGDDPTDKAFRKFLDLWARASTAARRLIINHLVGLDEVQPPAPKPGKGKRA